MPEVKTTSMQAFASQLQAWRKAQGWTQAQLATKIGYSSSLVSGVETTDKAPTEDFAKKTDDALGTPGTFATLQRLVAREAYPAFFAPVIPFEREAIRIHGWELGAIPGLLQTEEYARELIQASRPADDPPAIDRLVAARMDRQNRLAEPGAPMLWYVLDESILHRCVGDREVLARQLDKLLSLARTSGIVLQVLPFGARDQAGTDGPITVYEFADRDSAGYTECFSGGRIVETRDEVASLMTTVSILRAAAQSPRDSADTLAEIRRNLG